MIHFRPHRADQFLGSSKNLQIIERVKAMRTKLDCIMIVDNSMSDNFLHERMMQRMGCANHVAVMRTGHGAIDYLSSADKKGCLPPQLILLNLEMPGMNGWEFIEAYEKLHQYDKSAEIVVMFNALDGTEQELAGKPHVKDYIIKPLTEQSLQGLLELHFADKAVK